jgi:phytoene dehydrogenase-like protein
MAAEARARGAQIHLGHGVERIEVQDERACGVVLASGRRIAARAVAANVNPKLLYQQLIEAQHLPEDFQAAIRRYRCGSATLRINVALSELPDFSALRQGGAGMRPPAGADALDPLRSGIILAPSLDYMDRAHAEARLQGYSSAPVIEMLIPSTLDDSLAPPGAHVASLFCQHFAPELPHGRPWNAARDDMSALVFATIEQYAPNFRRSLVAHSVLTPVDLQERFGLTGGDIFHGALSLDQLWAARPVLGYGDYRSPITGLYLCGAGAHPGGGVSGLPGHNAARRILSDWHRLKRHTRSK